MPEEKVKHIKRATVGRSFADWDFDRLHFYNETEMGANVRELQKMWRAYAGYGMHPTVVKYWAEKGIRKEAFDMEREKGIYAYAVFTPMNLKPGKKYALIYVCHGGGEDFYQAETYGFAQMVATENFICVCANNGRMGPNGDNQYVKTEFPRIINELLEKGYPIDTGRIYVTGFSSGSDACDTLATNWPKMIAAVGPCPGPNSFKNAYEYEDPSIYEEVARYKMPIICVGGTADVEDHFPFDYPWSYENYAIWINQIAGIGHYQPMTYDESRALIASSDDPVEKNFGLKFDRTYVRKMEGTTWYFGEYLLPSGVVGAKMVCGQDKPHIHVGSDAPLIWNFFKHFSRDPETFASVYTPDVVDGMRNA